MSVPALRSAVAAVLSHVPSIGTVSTTRLDSSGPPRELRGTTPYWDVRVTRGAHRDAAFGGGLNSRPVFRAYTIRIEGWRGFVAANDYSAAWDALTQEILDALTLADSQLARYPGVRGYQRLSNLTATGPDVLEISDGAGKGYRAHHVVITAEVELYEVLS
ncbi:MAG: hypothetical protein ACO1SX_13805 [Actinomycetota bacterium]